MPNSARWSRPALRHAIFVLAIAAASTFAYAPALNRVFMQHDSLWYLAELEGSTSLWDGLKLYDYNRVCRYQRSDTALFRPLFFAWLAATNAISGNDHVLRNVCQLAAHVAVSLLLYRLLWSIQPGIFAGLFALVFAVHTGTFGLVAWSQVALLPAMACMLLAFRDGRLLLHDESKWVPRRVAAYLVWMTLATFGYELMAPVSAVFAGLVLLRFRTHAALEAIGRSAIALAPGIVFAGVYAVRGMLVETLDWDRTLGGEPGGASAVEASFRILAKFTAEFLAFGGTNYLLDAPYARCGFDHSLSWSRPGSGASQLIALAAIAIGSRGVSLTVLRREAGFIAWVAATMVGYLASLMIGRGFGEAIGHEHYPYLFCLLAMILAYSVADWATLRTPLRRAMISTLLAAAALNAWHVHMFATQTRAANAKANAYLAGVAEFVESHAGEPGFSFAIADPPSRIDPSVEMFEGRQDDPAVPRVRTRAIAILFPTHYRADDPHWRLHWNGSRIIARESRREPATESRSSTDG